MIKHFIWADGMPCQIFKTKFLKCHFLVEMLFDWKWEKLKNSLLPILFLRTQIKKANVDKNRFKITCDCHSIFKVRKKSAKTHKRIKKSIILFSLFSLGYSKKIIYGLTLTIRLMPRIMGSWNRILGDSKWIWNYFYTGKF